MIIYSPCPRLGISDKTLADLRSITRHPGSVSVEEAIDAGTSGRRVRRVLGRRPQVVRISKSMGWRSPVAPRIVLA